MNMHVRKIPWPIEIRWMTVCYSLARRSEELHLLVIQAAANGLKLLLLEVHFGNTER